MELPPYFLPRPPMDLDADKIAAFDRLFTEAVASGNGAAIEYTIDAPKWQFLCYLTDHKDVVLHGSGAPDIEEFEPRQSNDTEEFGNRRAVYAASDGIWPMYFAIADRDRYVTSLTNACFRVVNDDGTTTDPYYFFSINEDALPHNPWRNGTIYILPRETFEQQPRENYRGRDTEIEQLASLVAVKPLAKLHIEPEDFPFLSQVRGHDPKTIGEKARRDPRGFPWIEE